MSYTVKYLLSIDVHAPFEKILERNIYIYMYIYVNSDYLGVMGYLHSL